MTAQAACPAVSSAGAAAGKACCAGIGLELLLSSQGAAWLSCTNGWNRQAIFHFRLLRSFQSLSAATLLRAHKRGGSLHGAAEPCRCAKLKVCGPLRTPEPSLTASIGFCPPCRWSEAANERQRRELIEQSQCSSARNCVFAENGSPAERCATVKCLALRRRRWPLLLRRDDAAR